MKKDFLFPHSLGIPGWIISIVCLPVGVWMLVENDGGKVDPYGWLGGYFPTVLTVVLILGLLMVAFSREKAEDEYVTKLRASSLVWAIIANYVLLLLFTLLVYDLDYVYVLIVNLFTPLLLYILKFRTAVWKFRKSA